MYSDLSFLREITQDNYEVIILTIEKFSTTIPEMVENIEKYLDKNDIKALGAEAHKLLSSAGILKINLMYNLCRSLEENCKMEINLHENPRLVEQLVAVSKKVSGELEQIKMEMIKDLKV